MGRSKGERPVGRPRSGREDNIKVGLQEVGLGLDWFDLAYDRDIWRVLVNSILNLCVP